MKADVEAVAADLYDTKYALGYRSQLRGYEIAREQAIRHFVTRVSPISNPQRVLDYGAGRGLHVPLWQEIFPGAELFLCDVSDVARKGCLEAYSQLAGNYRLIEGGRADFHEAFFDVVLSVEVMEHVMDLSAYLEDAFRVLRPGGLFVFTTPCANRFSIEHLYSLFSGRIDATEEGYRLWRWEDPTHLRRMRSDEMQRQLLAAGFSRIEFRFRSHLFSFLCTYFPPRKRFTRLRNWMMTLDYALFRKLPNGASVICMAEKPL